MAGQQTMAGQNDHYSVLTNIWFASHFDRTHKWLEKKQKYFYTITFQEYKHLFSPNVLVKQVCSSYYGVNREVKFHVYVKRQKRTCTTWPSFPLY